MFLNTTWQDFDEVSTILPGPWVDNSDNHSRSLDATRSLLSFNTSPSDLTIPRGLSPLSLSTGEASLWNYFNEFIAPRCVLKDGINPYRQIILRIAAASPGGPVYRSILAVSAHQMQVLRHSEQLRSIWTYRDHALFSLRKTISEYSSSTTGGSLRKALAQQITASTLMMCFFEILHDCSRSWEVHATFARSFLMSEICHELKNDDFSSSLYAFASTYFVYHDALAFTASPDAAAVPQTASRLSNLIDGYDSSIFMTLTGCSKRLIDLLSQITSLANSSSTQTSSRTGPGPPEGDVSIQDGKRNSTERELHQMQTLSTQGARAKSFSDEPHESEWISELKRLTSLMYLYARIDGCNPSHPHMFRLTTQILEIIPKISLRTNTLLWPLFTVATLDEDRRMILKKLHLLQQTRQLGNVRKARRIIEDVWKARDLETSNAEQGWSILAGRYDTISLA
ncbi:hypothetical protein GCG54_00005483 [Colletotrichum gloeosporioides]|uniref:Fungal-specific transcription factor domain-containing protein n=1 Tax=Colletotrichum gloeosporioides TaxID=474922 RepID=A0A8H4CCU3_COLGL|nr:uncharacterized protein GCG54_00005483 [Colletotrichum gloeosporioides]KAF3801327.1 hypothetical protein GCG54_00005483 [Colletotrichum gloeosporioides]